MKYNEIPIESVSMWLDIVNTINKKLLDAGDISEKYFFRGQGNREWPVMPSVFRKREIAEGSIIELLDYEDLLIKEMIRISQESFNNSNDNFEILTQLQHFSVPTRLIDITENPLVALYFACSTEYQWEELSICTNEKIECELKQVSERRIFNGQTIPIDFECCPSNDEISLEKCKNCEWHKVNMFYEIKDGEIIVCKEKERYSDDDEVRILAAFANFPATSSSILNDFLTFLDKSNNIRIDRDHKTLVNLINALSSYICVSPKLNNPRILRQNGSFLICGTKFKDNIEELNVKEILNLQISKLAIDYRYEIERKNELNERYIIKHSNKQMLLKQLNMLGINEGTLFPELEHQASYVKSIIHEKIRPKIKLESFAESPENAQTGQSQGVQQYPSVYEIIETVIADVPLSNTEKKVLTKTITTDNNLFKEKDWFLFNSRISANNILLKKHFMKCGISADAAKQLSDKIIELVKQKCISEAVE